MVAASCWRKTLVCRTRGWSFTPQQDDGPEHEAKALERFKMKRIHVENLVTNSPSNLTQLGLFYKEDEQRFQFLDAQCWWGFDEVLAQGG